MHTNNSLLQIIQITVGAIILLITLLFLAPAIVLLLFWAFIYKIIYPILLKDTTVANSCAVFIKNISNKLLTNGNDYMFAIVTILCASANILATGMLILISSSNIGMINFYILTLVRFIVMSGLLPLAFTAKHQESHRALISTYKNKHIQLLFGRLNEWVTGIIYGNVPEIDRLGHGIIHHANNGSMNDDWFNEDCDRSSIIQFCKFIVYAGIYHNSGVGLITVFIHNKMWNRFIRTLIGMIFYYGLCIVCFLNLDIKLFIFLIVIPYLSNIGMASIVNWSWHIFANPIEPGNIIQSTINIIDAPLGLDIFYEGLHLSHHLRPGKHYTEIPQLFEKEYSNYSEAGSIILKGLDPFGLWALVMLKQWRILADCYINPPQLKWSIEQKMLHLRYRTLPCNLNVNITKSKSI